MYFITKEHELIGKTIAFTHFAQFADKLTIATDDGGIMVIEVEDYGDGDKSNHVLQEYQIKNYLMKNDSNRWIMKELSIHNIITEAEFEEYEREKNEKREQERLLRLKEQEERERQEFERLKAKFQ